MMQAAKPSKRLAMWLGPMASIPGSYGLTRLEPQLSGKPSSIAGRKSVSSIEMIRSVSLLVVCKPLRNAGCTSHLFLAIRGLATGSMQTFAS
jgi:hypothetical protein